MHFYRPDRLFEFSVNYISFTIHLFRSVTVVTDELIELNKTCMAAILEALSTVMNENRRNKVFTAIKQLKMREYSKDAYFSLNYYTHVIFILTLSVPDVISGRGDVGLITLVDVYCTKITLRV